MIKKVKVALVLLPFPCAAVFSAQGPAQASGQAPDGAAIFKRACAVCHRSGGGTRAPLPDVLRQMTQQNILRALEAGKMKQQGLLLQRTEREAVAAYLGRPADQSRQPARGLCDDPAPWVGDHPAWNGWSVDAANKRFQGRAAAGLTRPDVPRLKLKWAFGFPGASSTNSQPTVFAGRVFVGGEDGSVYSLDARSGCARWGFKAKTGVRTAVSVHPASRTAFFGDAEANVYSVDAETGKPVWKTHIDPHPAARITGAPLLVGSRLFVPVSSGEEGSAADPHYACCTFRGSVVALDTRSGKEIWKAYTIPDEPRRTGANKLGIPNWGPSGAAVWSAPTADLKRHAIYVATGNSYSDPPSPYSDAVLAFDMATGRMLWSRQLTPPDRWNIGCVVKENANCPPGPGDDVDFGSPPMLCPLVGGGDLLVIGQKSGVVHALNPDHKGELVWQMRIGRGGLLGGIEWGGAADDRLAYFPLSDWQDSKPLAGGGLFALRVATGQQVWYARPPKPGCVNLPGCSAALIAPVTLIPGVVFSGSYDGHLRAYDARSGSIIWDFPTLRDFDTVNGVKARGGSLGATGATVVDGMVFAEAGYGGIRGNVLLAFSVEGR